MNTIAVCTVSAFAKEGHQVDKNGNQNVFLSPLSGKIPNKCMVLAGSVAINNKIEIGRTYLFQFTEQEVDATYGRQFNTQKLSEVSALEIMDVVAKHGAATVITVTDTVEEKADAFTTAKSEQFAKV